MRGWRREKRKLRRRFGSALSTPVSSFSRSTPPFIDSCFPFTHEFPAALI